MLVLSAQGDELVDLNGLRYFLHVAKLGNISSAARDLGIVQPALSRHISRLEDELGVELLVRLPRGVELTSAGRLFAERAHRMMRELERAKEDVLANYGNLSGEVSFGILGTLAQTFVPRIVRKIQDMAPGIFLRIIEGSTSLLHEALLSGRIQAAILSDFIPDVRLEMTPLTSELIAVFAPTDVKRTNPFYTLAELVRTPLIVSAGVRQMVDAQIWVRGSRLNVEFEVDSVEAIRRILKLGMGTTLLPVSTLKEDVEAGDIAVYPVADINLHRVLAIAQVRTELSNATKEVIRIARSEVTHLAAEGVFSSLPSAEKTVSTG